MQPVPSLQPPVRFTPPPLQPPHPHPTPTPTPHRQAKYLALAAESKAASARARAAAKAARGPLAAYPAFVAGVLQRLKAERPHLPQADLMREAAARWRVLPEAEKAAKKVAADRARAQWAASHPKA